MSGLWKPSSTYMLVTDEYAKRPGESYLRDTEFGAGLAPYGVRHAGDSLKSTGYFGFVRAPTGVSTEISSVDEYGREYPLMVPTLSRSELDNLVRYEGDPAFVPERTYQKAEDWAAQRRAMGMSPFAQPTELWYPVPPREPEYDTGSPALWDHIRKQVDDAFDKTK